MLLQSFAWLYRGTIKSYVLYEVIGYVYGYMRLYSVF